MSNVLINKDKIDSLATALSLKTNETLPLTLIEMTEAIDNILVPEGTLSITSNGTGIDVTEYANVDVNVSSSEQTINNQDKSVTPTESQQSVTADSGYTGLGIVTVGAISTTYIGSEIARKSSTDLTVSDATVTAPAGYYSTAATKSVASGIAGTPTATKGTVSNHSISVTPSVTNTTGYISGGTISGTAVTVSASELVSGTKSITANDTEIDVTNFASIDVSVPTGTARTSTDVTVSGDTITIPAGLYSSQVTKSVASGTAGTPTASKGTVSNHSVSVTPSVTNTTGYITGSTKTGTAVTVTASELVSGTYTVDSSGTKDVTNYASASIAAGTAGTPSASKGTVNNHAITVTPSVTNITGWITGSTINGTGISVSASELVSGTLSITSSGTKDVTNYASASVSAGTEGTPIATKGSVSNHSISVTPSVTNTGGYITGSTKTGTAVTVSASELVSGSETKSSNGTYDVTNLASLVVDIPFVTYYTGTTDPASSLGSNDDIYLKVVS